MYFSDQATYREFEKLAVRFFLAVVGPLGGVLCTVSAFCAIIGQLANVRIGATAGHQDDSAARRDSCRHPGTVGVHTPFRRRSILCTLDLPYVDVFERPTADSIQPSGSAAFALILAEGMSHEL